MYIRISTRVIHRVLVKFIGSREYFIVFSMEMGDNQAVGHVHKHTQII